jgi:hypothetical protein
MCALSRQGGKLFPNRTTKWIGSLDPVFVLDKQMLDRNVFGKSAGKKMLHEKIAAWADQPSLLNLLPPEGVVERLPKLFV